MWCMGMQCKNKKIITWELLGVNFLDFIGAKVVMVCEFNYFEFFFL